MRKTAFKALVFVLILIALAVVNMYAFRSDFPKLWFITLIGSVIGLLLFPYEKFFKNNKKQN